MMSETVDTPSVLVTTHTDDLRVRTNQGSDLAQAVSLVIHKETGLVGYAVLSIGGFLGINRSYYPVPFKLLEYDTTRGDYKLMIDRASLEGGPSWSNNAPLFDEVYAARVSSYYVDEAAGR